MPIIRDEIFEPISPHIYEIYFSVNGTKTISYIGKSSGENAAYISGSSELNRVIANTVLCFGEEIAASGWHKTVLARFPSGTDDSVIDTAEKLLVLDAYDECRRLGPGRSWEILNKEYLQRAWKSDAKPVLTKLRAYGEGEPSEAYDPASESRPVSTLIRRIRTSRDFKEPPGELRCAEDKTGGSASVIEANFFRRVTEELGRSVPVPVSLMAYPGLKRTSIKLRILLCVIVALQKSHRITRKQYVLKTSTLRYLLRESNLTYGRVREAFTDLASALDASEIVNLTAFSGGDRSVQFQITCDLNTFSSSVASVSVEFEKFVSVASQGQQSALGRRFFGILAAHQSYRRTGQGIPVRIALSILSGKDVTDCEELSRLRELQSSCIKGIKSSESLLCDALGVRFATNYFTKKKLRGIEAELKTSESDFRVLFDNAERPLSDFMVLVSEL